MDWKWYFTPDWGQHGSAFQALGTEREKMQVRKITAVVVGPGGEVGFMRWVPLHGQLCEEMGVMDMTRYAVFEASKECQKALEAAWEKRNILLPQNGGPRLRLS